MPMKLRARLSVAAMVLLAACTTNPITGRSQLMVVPESMAIRESTSAYSQMVGGLAKKNQIETGTARAERVRAITDRLIAQAVRFRPDSAKWAWQAGQTASRPNMSKRVPQRWQSQKSPEGGVALH